MNTWDTTEGQTQCDPVAELMNLKSRHPILQEVIEHAEIKQDPPKPSIGRIVHFVLDGGPNKGQHRPAIIARIWDDNPTIDSMVQLQVFTDGSNDGEVYRSGLYWATSVHYADPSENKIYSWHWPERI